jgi:ABC-2 type transport system permease protein
MNDTGCLLRLKGRILANMVRALGREPLLKTIVVTLFIAAWVFGCFAITYHGLTFLHGFPGIGDYLLGRLLYLFAFGVFIMLVSSNLTLAYPVLFARRENELLFALPLAPSAIVRCKLGETVFLSSWAFLFMAIPLMLAYFYAGGYGGGAFFISWLFFVPLVALCGAAGVGVSLLIGRFAPRRMRLKKKVVIACLCSAAAYLLWRSGGGHAPGGDQSLRFVNQLVAKCEFASWFLLPSRWVADGIFALSRGACGDAAFFWLLLVSNALFLSSLCGVAGERLLAAAWDRRLSRPAAARGQRRPSRIAWRSPVCGLVRADVISFCRDPGQWGQFALFFGLLGIYILNLRNLPYDLGSLFWRYLLFILNLSAMGFTLAGLSSRFFFPLMSLDLKRFWFLGLTPLRIQRILAEKYFLCVGFTVGITGLLALLSGLMLGVPPLLLASSIASVIFMGIAISGLSVGLGAVYPNPRASSPAEVISGFGGTVVLVLNIVYICVTLVLQGIPLYCHLKGLITEVTLAMYLVGSVCLIGVVSIATALITLTFARRKLEVMDL